MSVEKPFFLLPFSRIILELNLSPQKPHTCVTCASVYLFILYITLQLSQATPAYFRFNRGGGWGRPQNVEQAWTC